MLIASSPCAATQPPANTGFSFSSSPSPFGAPQAPTTSLFGMQAAPTAQPSPFGAAAAPQTTAFGAQTASPLTMPLAQSQDAAIKEIQDLQVAYTPTSPSFKFQYLFLNVVENPQMRIKPPHVDEIRWRQVLAQAGGPNNPDK